MLTILRNIIAKITQKRRRHLLESQVADDPSNIEKRKALVAHYKQMSRNVQLGTSSRLRHAESVLWLVKQSPTETFLSTPRAFMSDWEPDDFAKIKNEWERQVEDNYSNIDVLINAAHFMCMASVAERQLIENAQEIAARAAFLAPDKPELVALLAQISEFKMIISDTAGRRSLADEALQLRERLANLISVEATWEQLPTLAMEAFEAGDNAKATRYASELLQLVKRLDSSSADRAFHKGNIVLGRVALNAGDVNLARTLLLRAGSRAAGTVFGPNMILAKELLENGQWDVVLQYFDECEKFWPDKLLKGWRRDVRKEKIPEFGGNLFY